MEVTAGIILSHFIYCFLIALFPLFLKKSMPNFSEFPLPYNMSQIRGHFCVLLCFVVAVYSPILISWSYIVSNILLCAQLVLVAVNIYLSKLCFFSFMFSGMFPNKNICNFSSNVVFTFFSPRNVLMYLLPNLLRVFFSPPKNCFFKQFLWQPKHLW